MIPLKKHPFSVFISYSRKDAPIVEPIIDLMRTTDARIFRDLDNIAPGQRWRPAIARAIQEARTFVIFWCTHSKGSEEVRREYQRALQLSKDIVPVMLDSTPLIRELAEFNGLDFRSFVRGHSDSDVGTVADTFRGDDETSSRALERVYVEMAGKLVLELYTRSQESQPGQQQV